MRLRYINKLYDPDSHAEYTPEQKDLLPEEVKEKLTTRPLSNELIGMLISKAIELQSRTLEEQTARRWWVPILAAVLGVGGAILGAAVGALLKDQTKLPDLF